MCLSVSHLHHAGGMIHLLDLDNIVDWVDEFWSSTGKRHETDSGFEEIRTSTFKDDMTRSLAESCRKSYLSALHHDQGPESLHPIPPSSSTLPRNSSLSILEPIYTSASVRWCSTHLFTPSINRDISIDTSCFLATMSEKTHDMLFGLVLGLDGSFFQSTLFFRGLHFGFIFFVDVGG